MLDNDSGVFTFHSENHRENTVFHARGPNVNISSSFRNNKLTSTMMKPQALGKQRYNSCGYYNPRQQMHYRRETSPMSAYDIPYNQRPLREMPSVSSYPNSFYRGETSYRSAMNARGGSPMSVRSIDSCATVADGVSMLKNIKCDTYNDLMTMMNAFDEFKKIHFSRYAKYYNKDRKRIRKRHMRPYLKKMLRKSSYDSGEQGSNSSISDDDCMSTRTGFSRYRPFKENITLHRLNSDSRSIKSDLVNLRKTIRANEMYNDCTDNFKRNTFKNMFSIQNKSIAAKPHEILQTQGFSDTITAMAQENRRQHKNSLDNQEEYTLHQRKVIDPISDDTEHEEIFSSTLGDNRNRNNTVLQQKTNKNGKEMWISKSKEAHNASDFNSSDENLVLKTGSKPSIVTKKNSQPLNKFKHVQVVNDFDFAKPQLPVRKITSSTRQKIQGKVILESKTLRNRILSDDDDELHCTKKSTLSQENHSSKVTDSPIKKKTTEQKTKNKIKKKQNSSENTNSKYKNGSEKIHEHNKNSHSTEKANTLLALERNTKSRELLQQKASETKPENKQVEKKLNESHKKDKQFVKQQVPVEKVEKKKNNSRKEIVKATLQIPKNSFTSDDDNLFFTKAKRNTTSSKVDKEIKIPIPNKRELRKRKMEIKQTENNQQTSCETDNNIPSKRRRSARLEKKAFSKSPSLQKETIKGDNALKSVNKRNKLSTPIKINNDKIKKSERTNKTKTTITESKMQDKRHVKENSASKTNKNMPITKITKNKIEKNIINNKNIMVGKQSNPTSNKEIPNDFMFAKREQSGKNKIGTRCQEQLNIKISTVVLEQITKPMYNTQERVVSKSHLPLGNTEKKKNSKSMLTSQGSLQSKTQTLVNNENQLNQSEKSVVMNYNDSSMRPSFIKRKLFTQTLDVIDNKNTSNDSLASSSPQTNVYSILTKEKNKARKIVTNQSCLKRDVLLEESNLLDLIHKIVPPDRMNITSVTTCETRQRKSNNDNSKDKCNANLSISKCDDDNISVTFTDEEIFNVNKHNTPRKAIVTKNKVQTNTKKSTTSRTKKNNKNNNTMHMDNSIIKNCKEMIANSVRIQKLKKKTTPKKNGINKENVHKCVESFWNTDVESD